MSQINVLLFVFNMLPVYPLDGGQILWALLWFVLGQWQSLQIVAFLGMFFGGLAALLALVFANVWLGILAAFVVFRSAAGFFQARGVLHVQSLPRHDEAACPHCNNHPPKGPFWVCDHCETRFDTFTHRGNCPGCGAWFYETGCPDCGRKNRIDSWFPPPKKPEPEPVVNEGIQTGQSSNGLRE